MYHTDAELSFIIADCNAAISANPENPKIYTYLRDRDAARRELSRRIDIRGHREAVRTLVQDPLTIRSYDYHPSELRKRVHVSKWDLTRVHTALFRIAWDKKERRPMRHADGRKVLPPRSKV